MGKKSFESLSIRKLNQLFPHCQLNLYGNIKNIISNSNVSNNRGLINSAQNNFFANKKDTILEHLSDKILNAQDLTDAEKIKFLKLIKE